jgi:hypothetical protein
MLRTINAKPHVDLNCTITSPNSQDVDLRRTDPRLPREYPPLESGSRNSTIFSNFSYDASNNFMGTVSYVTLDFRYPPARPRQCELFAACIWGLQKAPLPLSIVCSFVLSPSPLLRR